MGRSEGTGAVVDGSSHGLDTKSSEQRRINLDQPRWDQSTYTGRAKHFFATTNPVNVLAMPKDLDDSKKLVGLYRAGMEPVGTTDEQVWKAKHLYDSAFHPDTGEKLFILGRMSFQVPGNMLITGCMLTFYQSTPAVMFWQFANQSFNSIVNYTNRNASTGVSTSQLLQAYAAATTASVTTAVGLNKFMQKRSSPTGGLISRLVPLIAVAASNCVNIPLMRQRELVDGINVETSSGEVIGKSKIAAQHAVAQVVPSRILMAVPAMFVPPAVMTILEKRYPTFMRPIFAAPTTVLLTGLVLALSTPMCCALFPQKSSISVKAFEKELQDTCLTKFGLHDDHKCLYNKGL